MVRSETTCFAERFGSCGYASPVQPMKKKPRKTKKDPAAVALGRRGGRERVKRQTAEERSESARKAANARWRKS